MEELVKTIAQSIVDEPTEVHVNKVEGDKPVIIELSVADDDMGKVIGKQGRIARAIRTVVKAAATKDGKKVVVDIQ
jgi:predicted RNA-binding protein YlqC (UPF0109 family)